MRRLLVVLVVLLVAPAGARAADPPPGATVSETFFASADGTQLHADVLRPTGVGETVPTPVLMVVSPYLGHTGQTPTEADPSAAGPSDRFYDFYALASVFARGYTVVQVDLRGYGGSSGCGDWGGPGEQADVKAAVEWAAKQPWANGRVGLYGKSYDGWTGIMALATRPKGLAAVVSQEPVVDGYRYIFMNGVHYSNTVASSQSFSASAPKPGSTLNDSPGYVLGDLTPSPGCATTPADLVNEALPDPASAFWAPRNLLARVKGATTPLFLSYGFLEDNTKPDHVFDVFSGVSGPKRAWIGQWDHVRGTDGEPGKAVVGRNGFADEAARFLDHYVKGLPLAEAPTDKDPPLAVQRDDGSWRSEAAWPPEDASAWTLALTPGTYADDKSGSTASTPTGGTWTVTQPLAHDVHVAGVPKLEVTLGAAAPMANLVATVYDVGPDAKGRILTRGATTLDATTASFELYAQDWLIGAGHRVAVHLGGDDASWYEVVPTQAGVDVAKGALTLPALRYRRGSDLAGKKSATIGKYEPATIAADVLAKATTVALPPALTERPAAAAAPAGAVARALSLKVARRAGRRLVVSGRAQGVTRVSIRVRRGTRVVARRSAAVRSGRYRAVVRVRRAGRYRVAVSAAGAKTRSTLARIR